MNTLQDYLKQATDGYAVSLTADQLKQFDTYYQLLTEWNQKINLTAITDPEGVAVKHFADSLAFFNYCDIPGGGSVIDIGTGAGFPGIVLKIVRPDIQLTLLDSLKKRFLFLEDLLNQLGLEATFLQGRAEAYGQNLNYRESYDVAVSRAVAQLNTLSEYCLPFVRLSGRFVAFKGGNSDEESRPSAASWRRYTAFRCPSTAEAAAWSKSKRYNRPPRNIRATTDASRQSPFDSTDFCELT